MPESFELAVIEAENEQLRETIAMLRKELEQAYTHDAFACRTRAGVVHDISRLDFIDRRQHYVVACDIDNLHALNNQYGHVGTDKRIKQLHVSVRDADIVLGGQIGTGDEFMWLIPTLSDAVGFAYRLLESAREAGLSVTVAVAEVGGGADEVNDIALPALSIIEQAKLAGLRGRVHTTMPAVSRRRQLWNWVRTLLGVRV